MRRASVRVKFARFKTLDRDVRCVVPRLRIAALRGVEGDQSVDHGPQNAVMRPVIHLGEGPLSSENRASRYARRLAALSRGCSLTRVLDVKLSMVCLPGSLFSPQ